MTMFVWVILLLLVKFLVPTREVEAPQEPLQPQPKITLVEWQPVPNTYKGPIKTQPKPLTRREEYLIWKENNERLFGRGRAS